MLFEYLVSSSRVTTLGLTLTGYTWQWRCLRRYLVEGIAWNMLGHNLQGENP